VPERLQRQRKKGWRKPPNSVIVDRTSKWGNPYRIGVDGDRNTVITEYEQYLLSTPELIGRLGELAGKDLICFCPLDQRCHAGVLLRLANVGNSEIGDAAARG